MTLIDFHFATYHSGTGVPYIEPSFYFDMFLRIVCSPDTSPDTPSSLFLHCKGVDPGPTLLLQKGIRSVPFPNSGVVCVTVGF